METQTAGAFGAPERIDLAPYKHALTQAPDLLQHLAHLVTPGRLGDNQPTAKNLQTTPARIAPLDQIDDTFRWLWNEAAYWCPPGTISAEYMIRRGPDLQILGPAGVKGTPQGGDILHAWATTLVNRILPQWATIEHHLGSASLWGQVEAKDWTEHADDCLLIPLSKWPLTKRDPVPERPRTCSMCGADGIFTEFVNVGRGTVTCARCAEVITPEAWLPVADVAEMLDVTERTVRNWMRDGLPWRRLPEGKLGKGRLVELGAARRERDYRAATRAMNSPNFRNS